MRYQQKANLERPNHCDEKALHSNKSDRTSLAMTDGTPKFAGIDKEIQ